MVRCTFLNVFFDFSELVLYAPLCHKLSIDGGVHVRVSTFHSTINKSKLRQLQRTAATNTPTPKAWNSYMRPYATLSGLFFISRKNGIQRSSSDNHHPIAAIVVVMIETMILKKVAIVESKSNASDLWIDCKRNTIDKRRKIRFHPIKSYDLNENGTFYDFCLHAIKMDKYYMERLFTYWNGIGG